MNMHQNQGGNSNMSQNQGNMNMRQDQGGNSGNQSGNMRQDSSGTSSVCPLSQMLIKFDTTYPSLSSISGVSSLMSTDFSSSRTSLMGNPPGTSGVMINSSSSSNDKTLDLIGSLKEELKSVRLSIRRWLKCARNK